MKKIILANRLRIGIVRICLFGNQYYCHFYSEFFPQNEMVPSFCKIRLTRIQDLDKFFNASDRNYFI